MVLQSPALMTDSNPTDTCHSLLEWMYKVNIEKERENKVMLKSLVASVMNCILLWKGQQAMHRTNETSFYYNP